MSPCATPAAAPGGGTSSSHCVCPAAHLFTSAKVFNLMRCSSFLIPSRRFPSRSSRCCYSLAEKKKSQRAEARVVFHATGRASARGFWRRLFPTVSRDRAKWREAAREIATVLLCADRTKFAAPKAPANIREDFCTHARAPFMYATRGIKRRSYYQERPNNAGAVGRLV